MSLPVLNERVLQSFLALAAELHFGRAALAMHVSQPALTATIKDLELQLGVRLFTRTSRHVELTEAGHVLVTQARSLVDQSLRAVNLVREASGDFGGSLRIGYSPNMNVPWLCSLLAAARTGPFSDAELQFVSVEDSTLNDHLIRRALHAAFCPGKVCAAGLRSFRLFQQSFLAAFDSRHPLARSASIIFEQVESEPVVWLCRDVNPLLYDSFMTSCLSHGYRPNVVQYVRTFFECIEFARAIQGITFVPRFMRDYYGETSIVFAGLPEDALQVEYNLAFISGSSPVVDRFARFVVENLRQCRSPSSELHHAVLSTR
ncbi:MAG: LysR family transcriptional regulator [Candidatus Solibacter sp.]|nr:LysR family transcriptional regulator [Candidatus Solibacter sp.]